MRKATTPRPIRAARIPNPGAVGVVVIIGTVLGGTGVATVIGGDDVGVVVPLYSTTLKSWLAVTSCWLWSPIAETVTMYSSGVNVMVSTGKDQVLMPPVPSTTFTVPAAPENSPETSFGVGLE